MEFLGITTQISIELLWILRLLVVLVLLVDHLLELAVADGAVAFAGVAFDALIMERMPAHKHNYRQGYGIFTAIAIFWIEIFGLRFQFLNFLPHFLYVFHV